LRFDVARVSPTVDAGRFLDEFYFPRRPALIEGAAMDWPASKRWTRASLLDRIERSPGGATRAPFWWDIDRSLVADDIRELPLVSELRRRRSPHERERSTRLWMSNTGVHTPWHCDGNCVEVFSVQVAGRKRFTLVSPETPIPLAPLSLMARTPDAAPAAVLTDHHDHTVFELRTGDALYLPRHWFHFVESLDAFNANIDWVWTDLASGPLDNPVSLREQDLVASLYPLFAVERRLAGLGARLGLPRLRVKHYDAEYTAGYGGSIDFAVARAFLRDRGWVRAYRTLLEELAVAAFR
jgi:hypothetical protein